MINFLFGLTGFFIGVLVTFLIGRAIVKRDEKEDKETIEAAIKLCQKTIIYLRDML